MGDHTKYYFTVDSSKLDARLKTRSSLTFLIMQCFPKNSPYGMTPDLEWEDDERFSLDFQRRVKQSTVAKRLSELPFVSEPVWKQHFSAEEQELLDILAKQRKRGDFATQAGGSSSGGKTASKEEDAGPSKKKKKVKRTDFTA